MNASKKSNESTEKVRTTQNVIRPSAFTDVSGHGQHRQEVEAGHQKPTLVMDTEEDQFQESPRGYTANAGIS